MKIVLIKHLKNKCFLRKERPFPIKSFCEFIGFKIYGIWSEGLDTVGINGVNNTFYL